MMPIVEARGRELVEPHLKVVNQTVLPVVDVDTGGDVHRRHQHHTFLHAALLDNLRHVIRDADELLPLLRVEPEVFGLEIHSAKLASALISTCGSTPARRSRRRPAAAIIAALSVESAMSGTNTGMPFARPRSSASARS